MAEAFALATGGMSIASLAIQIVQCLTKAIQFCESIKEAPADIQRILLELPIFSGIVSTIQIVDETSSLSEDQRTNINKCFSLISLDVNTLLSFCLDLKRKMNSDKRFIRSLARVQTVLSKSKISVLRGHLERTKSSLQMVQGLQIINEVRALRVVSSQTPKSLGYVWETGDLDDHVKIDDGLNKPFYLPLDLCSTPEALKGILLHKFKARKLPGLKQIELGHFSVFDWTAKEPITLDTWGSVVKGGRGIKMAFIMSSWHGFPRDKCMRCYEPGTSWGRYTKCSSCNLELRRVEPDEILFEAEDIQVGLDPKQYRDYRTADQKNNPSQGSSFSFSKQASTTDNNVDKDPPIDAVCKRLIVKWEPIYNTVHRYLLCRCVIRLNTPSKIEKEMTLLVFAPCPRHNTTGKCHLDYGNIDNHKDKYFEKYGGYSSFQAIIYALAPKVYEVLGSEKFLPAEKVGQALQDFAAKFPEGNDEGVRKVWQEYYFEVNDELKRMGFLLTDEAAQAVEEGRMQRRKDGAVSRQQLGIPDIEDRELFKLSEEQQRALDESPMMQELREILDGKYSGKPHWTLDN